MKNVCTVAGFHLQTQSSQFLNKPFGKQRDGQIYDRASLPSSNILSSVAFEALTSGTHLFRSTGQFNTSTTIRRTFENVRMSIYAKSLSSYSVYYKIFLYPTRYLSFIGNYTDDRSTIRIVYSLLSSKPGRTETRTKYEDTTSSIRQPTDSFLACS